MFFFEGRKSEKELPALAAQPRAFSSLLSLPSQAQSVIKAFRRQGIGDADVVNTARFFLSRLESLFAAQKVFQIFCGRAGLVRFASQRRDCVIYSVPLSLLSINPTDSPDSRISVGAFDDLSVGLCQSRKYPYLPPERLCVRLLPRPTGLPPMAFAVSFRIRSRTRKPPSNTIGQRELTDASASVQNLPSCPALKTCRRMCIYIEIECTTSLRGTALLPMCIRLTQ